MTLVLEESEEVSPELLAPLLDSLRFRNQVLRYSGVFLYFMWIIYFSLLLMMCSLSPGCFVCCAEAGEKSS